MHDLGKSLVLSAALLGLCLPAAGQPPADPVRVLVQRLDLERYKATIKGLTRFGDRRQGTQRNRDAIDWIEAQLKSYGCANTERLTYQFGEEPPHRVAERVALHQARWRHAPEFGVGGARQRGVRQARRRQRRSHEAARCPHPRPGHAARRAGRAPGSLVHQDRHDPSRARCISSPPIWTASASARRPMTMARAPRW